MYDGPPSPSKCQAATDWKSVVQKLTRKSGSDKALGRREIVGDGLEVHRTSISHSAGIATTAWISSGYFECRFIRQAAVESCRPESGDDRLLISQRPELSPVRSPVIEMANGFRK